MENMFNTDHEPLYGKAEQISPQVRRITAKNADKFTFKGTGTYIVGADSVAVIDPGPDDKKHISALVKALKGCTVSHILVTHTHRDHSPGARRLQKKVGGVLCGFGPHPKDFELDTPKPKEDETNGTESDELEESGDLDFKPEKFLSNGEILVGKGWTIESLYTPGHISNHLCFALYEENTIFTGDHIMGWSTSIIPPPAGNLEDYLSSLYLMLDRNEETYLPTHGPPITNPKPYTQALLEHRENRNLQILNCLKNGAMKIPDIVAVVYKDYPEELHKPAERSTWAHLIYLKKRGVITCDGDPTFSNQFALI